MEKKELETVINDLMKENEPNLSAKTGGYDEGYAEGYHDALVDVMAKCGIKTNEKYFD